MKQSRSVVFQRQCRIRALFSEHQTLQVSAVSRLLDVSELTIRRDFALLELDGFIERFHGGARLVSKNLPSAPLFEDKDRMKQRQKQQIARYIATLVQDEDTVFLNAGTTTLEIMRAINNKHITIVSNNALACTVIDGKAASLISTGGEYSPKNKSFTGISASLLIQKMYAQICILGVNGITAEEGITTSNYMETMINEELLKRCKGLRIAAADGSKIGKTFNFIIAPATSINLLVTDSSADSEALQKIASLGVEIVLADQLIQN